MNYNENMSEALSIIAHYPSVSGLSYATNLFYVGPFTMRTMRRILFILDVGVIPTSSTLNFSVQASNAVGGTWTTVPGTTITTRVAEDVGIVTVEVKAETIAAMTLTGTGVGLSSTTQNSMSPDTLPGPWIQGVLAIGAANSGPIGVIVLGEGGYYPASDFYIEDKNVSAAGSKPTIYQQVVA